MHRINNSINADGLPKTDDKLITQEAEVPRPFLKWPGGKRRLLKLIVPLLPRSIRAYHEPFVGGGAVFFWLRGNGFRGPAHLYDANEELVRTYLAIQNDPASVIAAFDRHAGSNCEDYYYEVRDQRPDSLSDAKVAGRMLYLNRACFNGLYRQNLAGIFNASWGKKAVVDLEGDRIYAAHDALRNTTITNGDFSSVLSSVGDGDLVYADPPYPDGFRAYCGGGFGDERQAHLAQVCGVIDQMGATFILSNRDCGFIRDLYSKYEILGLMAPRSISRTGAGRRKAAEVLVSNCGSVSQLDQPIRHWSVVPLNHAMDRALSFDSGQVGTARPAPMRGANSSTDLKRKNNHE